MSATCPHGYELADLSTGATICEPCGVPIAAPILDRAARIEAAATQIVFEITEAKKLGQMISFEWIRLTLKDALK